MQTAPDRDRLRRQTTYIRFVLALVAALVSAPGVLAHEEAGMLFAGAEKVIMPATDHPPAVDGAIAEGEYDPYGVWEDGAFVVLLAHNDTWLFVGAKEPGAGWFGIAFSSELDQGANVVTTTANASGAVVRDNFAPNVTDEMDIVPDANLGGTSDILAFAATTSPTGTTYEFAIPLASADPYDQHFEPGNIYPLVVALNETAQELPVAFSEGRVHFLLVYVARPSDDLAAVRNLLAANPSPAPALAAMVVLTSGTGAVVWRYVAPRKGDAR